MSNLRVEINYHAIATLSKGIKSQLTNKNWSGLEGSINLLCNQLDNAVKTAELEEKKNEKLDCLINAMRSVLVRYTNRTRRRK